MDKPTKQYLDGEYQRKIDAKACQETVDGLHPRKFMPGEGGAGNADVRRLQPIGLCETTGYLTSSQDVRNCFEYNNKQVAMYLKLLKCLWPMFIVLGAMCTILITFYQGGEYSLSSFRTVANLSITIGNLGGKSTQCHQADLLMDDKLHVSCPQGSFLQSLDQYGMQYI